MYSVTILGEGVTSCTYIYVLTLLCSVRCKRGTHTYLKILEKKALEFTIAYIYPL